MEQLSQDLNLDMHSSDVLPYRMKRFNMFLERSQLEFLEKLPGTISEHVRMAVLEYIERHTPKAITSPSRKLKIQRAK